MEYSGIDVHKNQSPDLFSYNASSRMLGVWHIDWRDDEAYAISEEQIMRMLHEAETLDNVREVCRLHNIDEQRTWPASQPPTAARPGPRAA
jgi:hypothetical protein